MNRISISFLIFFFITVGSYSYAGSVKQEHFFLTDINKEKKIENPFYTFNMFFEMPVIYGINFISDNRDFFYNSKHKFEKPGVLVNKLTAGIDFSYCIKNAGLAYSLDQAVTDGTNIDGNLIEPGAHFRLEEFNDTFIFDFYYGLRFNTFSVNGSTPENFTLPDENKINIFNISIKYILPVKDSLNIIFLVDNIYAYADDSARYGLNSGFCQLKETNIFNPKSFIEYNKYPVLAFAGVSFIHSLYNSYYLGNVYSWMNRYDNIVYAVPEKSIPVNTGFLNLSGFKFVNLFTSPISIQIFNSLLICNEQDDAENINRIVNGSGAGIDIRTDFASLNRYLGFLNGNLLIGYMYSFEYVNDKALTISRQAFIRYTFMSKW